MMGVVRRSIVALGLMATLLTAVGCSSSPPVLEDLRPTNFAVDGVSLSDYEAGQAVNQRYTQECLAKKGYQVSLPDPRLMNSSAVTGDGPVTAAINELMDPNPYQLGAGVKQASGTPGLREASDSCMQEALSRQYERMGAVKSIDHRLASEWLAYEQSSTYKTALKGFSECMSAAGHPAATPDQVGSELTVPISTVVNGATQKNPSITNQELIAVLEPLLAQEATLRRVGTKCWDDNLKEPLSEYRAKLWQTYPDDLVIFIKAIRNES